MNKKKKKSSKLWIFLLIGLVCVLIAGAVYKSQNKQEGIEVEVGKVEKRTIYEQVAASGKIFPEVEVKITSDVSGEIVKLLVEEGDSVKVGQLLARIDPDAYVSQVERGDASVNNSKAQLATAKSGIESSRAQMSQFQAQKEQILAQLDNIKAIHERNTGLFNDGVISKADFDLSKSNLDATLAILKSAEASMRTAEANLESSKQGAKAAEYTVKSMQASLRELKTNLNRTDIYAPTGGIVSLLNVEQGERVVGMIQMAGTELMRISNLNAMEVQVDVNESDVLKVTIGDKADIEVDAYIGKKFEGKVNKIANSASNMGMGTSLTSDQVTNFIVTIRVDPNSYKDLVSSNNKYPFRPGMSASVDIYTDVAEDVIAVPIQAVTTREDEEEENKKDAVLKELVFIYTAGDTVRTAEVSSGLQDDDYIQIKSGLSGDEKIVVGPYAAISRKLEVGDEVYEKEEEEDKKKKKKKYGKK